MKKIIVSIIIYIITFGIIILNINSKENKKEKEDNENISIILETEEGNIETNTFPSKSEYVYDRVVCENTNDVVTPTFNTNTWKLNLNIERDKIDGNFNCTVHFIRKIRYEFDFTKTDTLDNFKKTSGDGTFAINNNGLYYSSYSNTAEKWNNTIYTFNFPNEYTLDSYNIIVDYQIENDISSLGQFRIIFGNFEYVVADAWAIFDEGATLATTHNLTGEDTESVYWLDYSKSAATFNGVVKLTKTKDYVSLSGGYNMKKELSVSDIKFNTLSILFGKVTNYNLTPFYIRKIIIEEL